MSQTNPAPSNKPPNTNRFSGNLDFVQMARDAEDVERLVQATPEPPKKRGRKATASATAPVPPVTGGTAQTVATEDVKKVESTFLDWEPLNLGPEFPIMMVTLVGCGTDLMKTKHGWSDPGLAWRQKLGEAFARIIERILGRILHGRQEAAGDIIVLCSYIGMYVAANTLLNRQTSKLVGAGK